MQACNMVCTGQGSDVGERLNLLHLRHERLECYIHIWLLLPLGHQRDDVRHASGQLVSVASRSSVSATLRSRVRRTAKQEGLPFYFQARSCMRL